MTGDVITSDPHLHLCVSHVCTQFLYGVEGAVIFCLGCFIDSSHEGMCCQLDGSDISAYQRI